MSFQLVTPAVELPVSLEAAKAQLRELSFDQDDRITELIRRAAAHVERQAGIVLLESVWRLRLDRFPAGRSPIELRIAPVTSVDSVSYTDTAGESQTLAVDQYQTDVYGVPARIAPAYGACWPATRPGDLNAVTVEFTAGEAAAADLGKSAVQAILLLVEQWYAADDDKGRSISFTPRHGSIETLINDLRWDAIGGAL